MELSEFVTAAFVVTGITYSAVREWHHNRILKMQREHPVTLRLRDEPDMREAGEDPATPFLRAMVFGTEGTQKGLPDLLLRPAGELPLLRTVYPTRHLDERLAVPRRPVADAHQPARLATGTNGTS